MAFRLGVIGRVLRTKVVQGNLAGVAQGVKDRLETVVDEKRRVLSVPYQLKLLTTYVVVEEGWVGGFDSSVLRVHYTGWYLEDMQLNHEILLVPGQLCDAVLTILRTRLHLCASQDSVDFETETDDGVGGVHDLLEAAG